MPHYKEGKQTEQLEFSIIQEKVEATKKKLTKEQLSYFWLLYYSGSRKSELYERTVGDCSISKDYFTLDLGIRKKGSAQTEPLDFPLWFPGMDVVCQWLEKARSLKSSRKLLERWNHQKRTTSRIKAKWLFPNIHRSTANNIVKKILGSEYYPHFLRLNRITELCSNPQANLTQIKSFSGIKSTRIIEENYMGISKRQQRDAVNFIGKQIKKEG